MTVKRTIVVVFGLILVIAIIVAVKAAQINAMIAMGKKGGPPPSTVSSAKVEAYEWESTLTAIGSLEAAKGLEITADLAGRITKIHFAAGGEVSAGDLLIEQETSTERAQLRAAQSDVALQKKNFNRVKQLFNSDVASKSEYDSAQNAYQSALASADNIRASIEKKSIRAPFDGRLGIRLVNLGQSIDAGQPVVSLQATKQMFVNFFLPQQDLPKLQQGLLVRLRSDAVPDQFFEGTINAISPEINANSSSVEVQAILENTNNQLLPGMFANLDVVLPQVKRVLTVPITAVQYASYGASVFVIEQQDSTSKKLTARQQFVRLGATRGDYVVVEKGLSVGEEIVSTGGFKLRNGAPVVVNNTVVPDFSLSPSLPDR